MKDGKTSATILHQLSWRKKHYIFGLNHSLFKQIIHFQKQLWQVGKIQLLWLKILVHVVCYLHLIFYYLLYFLNQIANKSSKMLLILGTNNSPVMKINVSSEEMQLVWIQALFSLCNVLPLSLWLALKQPFWKHWGWLKRADLALTWSRHRSTACSHRWTVQAVHYSGWE